MFRPVSAVYSLEDLVRSVQSWCDEHRVLPANGQAAEVLTERTIRYYRTLGLLDAPDGGYVKTFSEKHRLQLIAIRLYQATGLPLRRIREELYGRSEPELRRLIQTPPRPRPAPPVPLAPVAATERWALTPLTDDFLLVSRRGRTPPPELLAQLRSLLSASRSAWGAENTKN
jgi:DNA-binding transcriptional MerR regulator